LRQTVRTQSKTRFFPPSFLASFPPYFRFGGKRWHVILQVVRGIHATCSRLFTSGLCLPLLCIRLRSMGAYAFFLRILLHPSVGSPPFFASRFLFFFCLPGRDSASTIPPCLWFSPLPEKLSTEFVRALCGFMVRTLLRPEARRYRCSRSGDIILPWLQCPLLPPMRVCLPSRHAHQ